VHEHLIIGDQRYYSFADQGHIARMNAEFDGGAVAESPAPASPAKVDRGHGRS
jgi:hypothetical protein